MTLLNGKHVPASDIDPAKHRFIGLFRPAQDPYREECRNIHCTCGQILQFAGESFKHWQQGCFDEPQYVDIAADFENRP